MSFSPMLSASNVNAKLKWHIKSWQRTTFKWLNTGYVMNAKH